MCQQLSSSGPFPNHSKIVSKTNQQGRGHTRSTRHLYKSYQEFSRTHLAGSVCMQSAMYFATCPHAQVNMHCMLQGQA